ncbi:tRNA glutamyl-Q(34) synthetase GluQRS [Rhabdaerophilum calidifontis]|uniref:tRNA glutamyl-Q(34) synthetase GluQRS n=1 Tax=Rhabdaerophilum calidifontis TaxID=2604328 RepID=UPI0012384D48|nr:tRNA glutamyl-Q(34) synthetase GluQRS [Rhabdaerophilum calidifontis]
MQPDFRQPVFRFAPSPNGHLHLGHAYSALLNAEMARRSGGRFLLRIEDIDTTRCTEALVADCLEDLAWLGLAWEEPVLRQSAHFDRYRAAAARLEAEGLLYPCFCSRAEIAAAAGADPPRDPEGAPRYPGTCRQRPPDEIAALRAGGAAFALRLDSARAARRAGAPAWREQGGVPGATMPDIAAWGDVVLVRKEIPTSYHLAVVLDDAMQGVTHVVRGMDLFAQTAIHRLLQTLLGLPEPIYHHHPLIRDADGRKLAKSAASTPLRRLRGEGISPAAIRRHLGFEA